MIPSSFKYLAPKNVEEALKFLSQHGEDARVLAGGHSLIPLLKLRLSSPKFLVDIGRIPGLSGIREVDGHIEIGALTTHAEVETSALLERTCPLLREVAAEIGDLQVRNRGTLGGSLAHADPAADYPAAILALEAEIVARGPSGERTMAAGDFFTDAFQTALKPGELLIRVKVPSSASALASQAPRLVSANGTHSGSAYAKVHQPASGFAIVGVAVVLSLDDQGRIHRARVGITGLAPKPFRAKRVERELEGKQPQPDLLRAAARHAAQGVEPLSDLHASAGYRAELARIHTRRALERALARAKA